jgi:hypothetical protein
MESNEISESLKMGKLRFSLHRGEAGF